MKYTKVKSDTFQTLQLNAGILVKGFDPSDGSYTSILGATTGGLSFNSNPKFSDFGEDVDNCPPNTKQLKRIMSYDPAISGTFTACTPELADTLVAAGIIDSSSAAHIIPSHKLTDADFIDVTAVGDYSDVNTGESAGFLAITIQNALNTNGFQWATNKDGKGQFAFDFHGHYDYDDPDSAPFDIYVKAGTGTNPTPSVTINRHVLRIADGSTATLNADVIPANQTVTWNSESSAVATVSGGVVSAEGEGNTIVTASITVGGVTYSDTCTVIVSA